MKTDIGWAPENRENTAALPLLGTRCEECKRVHFLAIGGELKAEDLIQARWNANLAQLTHGGWLCWSCVEHHADQSLLPAAEAVREGHRKIRVVSGWKAETVRGR